MIYTDALQTAIMLVGALTLMGYSKWGPLRGGRRRLSQAGTPARARGPVNLVSRAHCAGAPAGGGG